MISLPNPKNRYKKGFIAGTFDVFHVGHQFLLWSAAQKVENLVIVVARDETVKRIKNRDPQHTELKRLERIEREGIPSALVRLGRLDQDFLRTLQEESPDILFLGYDQVKDVSWIESEFPDLKIIRLEAYSPQHFKSSLLYIKNTQTR